MAPAPNGKAKGKGRQRLVNKSHSQAIKDPISSQPIPVALQQLLLNIFRNSFVDTLASDVDSVLQEVKGHLYDRNFAAAFGKDVYLEAYAARWSPSRALGYLQVFFELWSVISSTEHAEKHDDDRPLLQRTSKKVVCLGGGAGAEIVALAGLQSLLSSSDEAVKQQNPVRLDILALDIANWGNVVQKLDEHIVNAPPLSQYASATTRTSNRALVSAEDIRISFEHRDVLAACLTDAPSPLKDTSLVTLMFTLNELYSTSLPSTQRLLLSMTEILDVGSFLLIVDSPGSYSTVTLNGAEKTYPMQWLLDHTLLKQAAGDGDGKDKDRRKWEKVREDDSRWFRLNAALDYPIQLENMRMQLHLYRRI